MPIINTAQLPNRFEGSALERLQVYNGLDNCVTFEVHEALERLTNTPPPIYTFERALQAPALEMMLRGFRIDETDRQEGIRTLSAQAARVDTILQRYAYAIWGKTLNPRSQKQLLSFFYTHMKIPERWTSKKGVRKLSMDRETLEKLQAYFHAMPIIECILLIRDLEKQKSVLLTEVDPDGRMRTSYNIAGTETGRWSSSANAYGTGTNLQNIARKLRKMFVADPGWKLCGIDLEQAESREVGWLCGTLFNEWNYLDACEAADLHTLTCKLIWRELPWTDNAKTNRKIADQLFYREFSYRDLAKRGSHGSNYYGTPFTMARHLKVPTKLMEDFQKSYFAAFPGIPKWHRWTAQQLQTAQVLTTPFGRTRHFFGRPNDDATLREAIAFSPQSSTGDRMNLGLWRIWKELGTAVQILAQVHDAVYFQYREVDEAAVVARALELIRVTLTHGSRSMTIPGEAKTGWNWGDWDAKLNPNGLKKYKGPPDDRSRLTGLDRSF